MNVLTSMPCFCLLKSNVSLHQRAPLMRSSASKWRLDQAKLNAKASK
jgi:hypothetical protein